MLVGLVRLAGRPLRQSDVDGSHRIGMNSQGQETGPLVVFALELLKVDASIHGRNMSRQRVASHHAIKVNRGKESISYSEKVANVAGPIIRRRR